MLEPWIIEQIRRREEEARRRDERPRLEIPIHDERWKPDPEREDRDEKPEDERDEDKPERGVVIIDMRPR